MASNVSKRIVLLPIRPQYAHLIIRGEKKVEFRKVKFRSDLSHVVMYISKPIQKVLGYFEVSHIDENSPKELWARYCTVGGMSKNEFQAYYASSSRGIVIGIGKVFALRNPTPLKIFGKSLPTPQSFLYLAADVFQMIQGYSKGFKTNSSFRSKFKAPEA